MGWGTGCAAPRDHAMCVMKKKNPQQRELVIGKNIGKEKQRCVEEKIGWTCDENSGNPGKRLNYACETNWKDTFSITRNGTNICARRTDGKDPGWGMKLV